ncbi:MAG: hypothetical protein Q7J01_03740 [Syntrophales bacterium]|nr:hypothetical protein [Syntrophales bacterium]
MKKTLVIVLLGGLITFGLALNYHFILMDGDAKVLKKTDLTLDKTFVDARGTKKIKLYLDPVLVRAGIKDLLRDAGK